MRFIVGNECDRTWDCHFHEFIVSDLKWIFRFHYHTNIGTWIANWRLVERVHKIWAGDLHYVWCHMLALLMSCRRCYVVYRHRLFCLFLSVTVFIQPDFAYSLCLILWLCVKIITCKFSISWWNFQGTAV
jgi:hypothetical protein